ncbi:formate/nitrite transporter [Klebsiella grimontii]|uniref:Formate/nitrite transporter n=1 Tax=Klebsiella grimontii TaxID=2058152 RepID=A0A7H4NZE9_9ENTR|nr:formate/nitrite transporter [Klebsiella grimontii]
MIPLARLFLKISLKVMQNPPLEMFANAIISGWLVATMVWMFPAAGSAKIIVIILMTWLIALADTTHIVVGSVRNFLSGVQRSATVAGIYLAFRSANACRQHMRRDLYFRFIKPCADSAMT